MSVSDKVWVHYYCDKVVITICKIEYKAVHSALHIRRGTMRVLRDVTTIVNVFDNETAPINEMFQTKPFERVTGAL